ncbi:SpoIIE family protein phosphatase [Streptodolium elevatio]
MSTTEPLTPEAGARLLVVDDNAANRYVLRSWLERAGHSVVEAADGTAALATLARLDPVPELAIVDVRLPDMSGFEVCERIKADPRTTGVPVVHVSAIAVATDDRTQGLYRGADAYLTEPIAPTELLATVTAALRYSRARTRAERLTERIRDLHRATLDVYATQDVAALAEAAAAGAFGLFGTSVLVLAQASRSEPVHVARHDRHGPANAVAGSPRLLAALAARVLSKRVGVGAVDVPAREWRGLHRAATEPRGPGPGAPDPRGADPVVAESDVPGPVVRDRDVRGSGVPGSVVHDPATGLDGDVLVVVARARAGQPPVCMVVDAGVPSADEARPILTQFAQAVAMALEAVRTYAEEHDLAVTLQRSLLPARLPDSGATMAVRYLPAAQRSEVGGDFYDAFATDAGLLVAVGDVAGHSLEAAVVMGQLRHALRAYALEGHGLRELVVRLDAYLDHECPTWTATMCLVLVAPDRSGVEVANAGHLPPLLARPGERPEYLTAHGPLLGVGLVHPETTTHRVVPGTRLVMITDGLVERRRGDMQVQLDRLLELVAKASTGGPGDSDTEGLCDLLVDAFGGADHEDDVVVVAVDIEAP